VALKHGEAIGAQFGRLTLELHGIESRTAKKVWSVRLGSGTVPPRFRSCGTGTTALCVAQQPLPSIQCRVWVAPGIAGD
jgi:hypothetical protein